MIARLDALHAGANLLHDAAAFMSEDHREQPFGVLAGKRERIGMTNAGRHHLDQYFTGLRRGNVHLFD